MLTVLTRIAIMMPRLKYLLSTMPRSLARVSRHTSSQSRAAPSAGPSSSSFPSSEEAPSSLVRATSAPASSSLRPESPEPEPSWPESLLLPGPEGRRSVSRWQQGQLAGSEASKAEMGCTSVWGVGSRGLCRGHNSGKEAEVRVGPSGHPGGSPHLQSVWHNLGHHLREPAGSVWNPPALLGGRRLMVPGETCFPFWVFLAPKKKQGPEVPTSQSRGVGSIA